MPPPNIRPRTRIQPRASSTITIPVAGPSVNLFLPTIANPSAGPSTENLGPLRVSGDDVRRALQAQKAPSKKNVKSIREYLIIIILFYCNDMVHS